MCVHVCVWRSIKSGGVRDIYLLLLRKHRLPWKLHPANCFITLAYLCQMVTPSFKGIWEIKTISWVHFYPEQNWSSFNKEEE